jgi:MarR family transcriptional regulator, transcriptional regulator for hemolysin
VETLTNDAPADELWDLRRRASLKLALASRLIRRQFDQQMAELGVTRSQWTVIAIVARAPGTTQRELAQALDISEASTGRLVDRLCAEGLVERRPKEDDRRAHCVFLTEQGDSLTSKLTGVAQECEQIAFAHMSSDEVGQLGILLNRIVENLGKH